MSATILITGATDGLGLALARQYQAQAARLILVGRRSLASVIELDSALFKPTTYCQADLSQPDCARRVVAFLKTHHISRLNYLIHNAGLGYYGSVKEQSSTNIQDLVTVNLMAPLTLTHALLPFMTPAATNQLNKVVLISSVVSAVACPDYAVYGATKAALDGFGRSLRLELQGIVEVQVIQPGATRTGMHRKSGLAPEVVDWRKFPPADQVARQIAVTIRSARSPATIGLSNKLLRWAGYYFGSLTDWWQRRQV